MGASVLGEYGYLGFLLGAAVLFPLGGLGLSLLLKLIGVRQDRPNPVKLDVYECGVETEGPTWVRFHVRYYLIALLFVVFDIEAVFLFPWAVSFNQVTLYGVVEALLFLLVLAIGFAYAWRKHALDWR